MTRLNYNFKIKNAKRIVIKIGSSLLAEKSNDGLNAVNKRFIGRICSQVAALKKSGREIVLVSSGAVATGQALFSGSISAASKYTLPVKQAYSSIGQPHLIETYRKKLLRYGLQTGQVLVTESNIHTRKEYLNLQATILQLLKWNAIPIVNENDSVAISELNLGDNDILSATVLDLVSADLLILLTTVDGFYKGERRIDFLDRVTKDDLKYAQGPTGPGRGGMKTKLQAANIALKCGSACAILNGLQKNSIGSFFKGKDVGTFFASDSTSVKRNKRWMLYSRRLAVYPLALNASFSFCICIF